MLDALISLVSSYLVSGGEETDCSEWVSMDMNSLAETLEFASLQGLLPCVCAAIEHCGCIEKFASSERFLEYYGAAMQMRIEQQKRLTVSSRLSSIFASKGLDVMFFKGAALADIYPDPYLRFGGDVDYYLYGHAEEGDRALEELGVSVRDYYHHHTRAKVDGVMTENHFDFIDRKNHSCNIILDDSLKALASSEGKNAAFLIEGSYRMTPTMNAIFLMRHMSAHFASETTTLRQLYDWGLVVRNYSEMIDWNLVAELYEKSGMMAFARVVKSVLEEKMSFPLEAFPVPAMHGKILEKVWDSITHPRHLNNHRKGSLLYWLRETVIFASNKWKHDLVYPGESYLKLFLRYTKSVLNGA